MSILEHVDAEVDIGYPSLSLSYFCNKVSHWTWISLFWLDWLSSKPPGSSYLSGLSRATVIETPGTYWCFDFFSSWILVSPLLESPKFYQVTDFPVKVIPFPIVALRLSLFQGKGRRNGIQDFQVTSLMTSFVLPFSFLLYWKHDDWSSLGSHMSGVAEYPHRFRHAHLCICYRGNTHICLIWAAVC